MTRLRARAVSRSVRALALCVLVLAVASLAAIVEPARACSCVSPDPWSILRQADGAFVGRLTSREDIGEGRAHLTFSVERAVKGQIGASVEVLTANNGAACGIETSVGQRIGLFVSRENGRWMGTLCWQVAPEDLLAAAVLPAPNGRGPVAMFVGGRFGPARTLALDAHGRTLAYGIGRGNTSLLSLCPGNGRVAEIARSDAGSELDITFELTIRDARTLFVLSTQTIDLPGLRFPNGLLCENPAGSRVVIFAGWAGDSALRAALYRVSDGRLSTVWHGTAFLSSFGPSAAYLRAGFSVDRFVKVDLTTGRVIRLARLRLSPWLVPDERGKIFAGVAYRLDRRSRLFVVDVRRRPPAIRSVPLAAAEVAGDVVWMSNHRLMFLPWGGPETARVLDLGLRTRERFRWTGAGGTLVGSTAFGLGRGGTLVAAAIPDRREHVVRRLPGRPQVIISAPR